MVEGMPPVTLRSPAVTEVAAFGAARMATAARLTADLRVPVVRVSHTAPTHRLFSPVRTGRDPPAESLHPRTTARAKPSELRPFFFFHPSSER